MTRGARSCSSAVQQRRFGTAQVQAGISIVQQLVECDIKWLVTNKDVFEKLIALWNSPASAERRRGGGQTAAPPRLSLHPPARPARRLLLSREATARPSSSSSSSSRISASSLTSRRTLRCSMRTRTRSPLISRLRLASSTTTSCVKATNKFKKQIVSRLPYAVRGQECQPGAQDARASGLINPMLLASYGPHPRVRQPLRRRRMQCPCGRKADSCRGQTVSPKSRRQGRRRGK